MSYRFFIGYELDMDTVTAIADFILCFGSQSGTRAYMISGWIKFVTPTNSNVDRPTVYQDDALDFSCWQKKAATSAIMEFDNLCDWYTHLLQKSPTQTIHVHVLGNTITANPENVEYMLKTRFDNYPKGKPFSTILGDLLGRGIFNVDGDLWRFQRKMASLELGRISIKSHAFEVVSCEIENRLLPLLSSVAGKENCVLDLQDVFRRFSFDSMCRFSFGLDPKCLELSLPMSEFAVSFDLASKLSAERAMTASPLVWKMKRSLILALRRG
ncbi:hypothetical protein F0562_016795 [Nyssa sinensis]|uniref:Cytochrome P450 n=1 Tax=Nyssa sinensis TaxID=561372 RepID=A0A5J4ZFB6_9ASTE|nr:hypothetical protein F0562_016795 [Nyssa sinensis]